MGRRIYLYGIAIALLAVVWFFSGRGGAHEEFSETVKVSLREVGNQLFLSDQDSTSLVLPILELQPNAYQLSFEHPLSFDPASLVASIDSCFQRLGLPQRYRVAVIRCSDKEVAYSYEMNVGKEITLIPCRGRLLPEAWLYYSATFHRTQQGGYLC